MVEGGWQEWWRRVVGSGGREAGDCGWGRSTGSSMVDLHIRMHGLGYIWIRVGQN
jgi:hypothetical protein